MTERPGPRTPVDARRRAPDADRDQLVATVAGRPISAERVERRLADMRRGPRARHIAPDGLDVSGVARRWVVQELVMEAVLIHEARVAGIADVGDTGRLSPGDVATLVARVTADVTVPDEDVRAYHDRNRDLYDRPEGRIPFGAARAAIEADLLVAARGRAFDEWLDGRRRALVVIEPGFEHPGHPSHGVPSHRH